MDELDDLGIPDLVERAGERGLVVLRWPIDDLSVRSDVATLEEPVDRIPAWVDEKAGRAPALRRASGLGRANGWGYDEQTAGARTSNRLPKGKPSLLLASHTAML